MLFRSNLQITAPYIITYAATSYVNGIAIPGSQQTFMVPPSVLACLGANNTVNNLLTLANQVLGNASSCSASLQNVHDAVMAINMAFDHCRILGRFSATNPKNNARTEDSGSDDSKLLLLNSYPNPFSDNTTIEFTLKHDSYVTVEVFNAIGQKVASLYKGYVYANERNAVLFDGNKFAEGMYFVKVSTHENDFYHKMMLTR